MIAPNASPQPQQSIMQKKSSQKSVVKLILLICMSVVLILFVIMASTFLFGRTRRSSTLSRYTIYVKVVKTDYDSITSKPTRSTTGFYSVRGDGEGLREIAASDFFSAAQTAGRGTEQSSQSAETVAQRCGISGWGKDKLWISPAADQCFFQPEASITRIDENAVETAVQPGSGDPYDAFLYSTDGTLVQRWHNVNILSPVWSPSEKLIAATLSTGCLGDSCPNIVKVFNRANGKAEQWYHKTSLWPSDDAVVQWSPDDKFFVFSSTDNVTPDHSRAGIFAADHSLFTRIFGAQRLLPASLVGITYPSTAAYTLVITQRN